MASTLINNFLNPQAFYSAGQSRFSPAPVDTCKTRYMSVTKADY